MRWAMIAAMAVAAAVTVGATVTVPLDFRQIVTSATVIVQGHVTDVRSVLLPTRGIDSIATVAVDAALKGTTDAFVSVRVPGGQVGNLRVVAVDAPTFTVAERAVFFLKRGPDGALRPVGLSLGIFRISVDPQSGQTQIDPPLLVGQTAALGPVVHGDPARRLLSVPEFESLIRLVLATQAAPPGGGR